MMKLADIPGMSVALISNGKLVWRKNLGVANAETGQAVTDSTIFEALLNACLLERSIVIFGDAIIVGVYRLDKIVVQLLIQ